MVNFLAGLGAAVLVGPLLMVLLVALLAWRAWWLYPAWGWFVVPLGVRPIEFWHFAALVLLASTLSHHSDTKKDDRQESVAKIISSLLGPVLVWAVMWWIAR